MTNVNGFTLTKAALHTSGLTMRQKLVLMAIADHANNNGDAYPSMAAIAELACMSPKRRTDVTKTIDELVKLGYIKRGGLKCHKRIYKVLLTVTTGITRNSNHRGYTNIPYNKPATPPPTAEPTEPLANCAQRATALADGSATLAQSATPTRERFKHRRPVANTYTFEGEQYRRSLIECPPDNG